jgi:hypothetical protein
MRRGKPSAKRNVSFGYSYYIRQRPASRFTPFHPQAMNQAVPPSALKITGARQEFRATPRSTDFQRTSPPANLNLLLIRGPHNQKTTRPIIASVVQHGPILKADPS